MHVVRPMVPADAAAVARVHVAVWQHAYAGLMAPDFLAGLSVERFTMNWESVLSQPAGDSVRLVGRDAEGALVGFGLAGPSRGEQPREWELYALNLLPDAQGTGLADALMAELVGDRPATLWVVQGNARAIGFYERHGFVADGGTERDERMGVTELRMVR